MTAPRHERFVNVGETELDEDIDGSVTSFDVVDASVFPSAGNFRLVCGTEIMLCTGISSNTITVVRGYESSSAASHVTGNAIAMVLTAGGINRPFTDLRPQWGSATYLRKLGLYKDDGSPLVASDFTWENQGSAAVTDQDGTILLSLPTESSTQIRWLTRTAPSAPYLYVGCFQWLLPCSTAASARFMFFGFRQTSSSDGEIMSISTANQNRPPRFGLWRPTSNTTFATDLRAAQAAFFTGDRIWFAIQDDNTNLIYRASLDGVNWLQVGSAGRTAHMATTGPNQVAWGGGVVSSTAPQTGFVRLIHWERTI